jgi:hypothetical protein
MASSSSSNSTGQQGIDEFNRAKQALDERFTRLNAHLDLHEVSEKRTMDINVREDEGSHWVVPNTSSTRAAATIVSIINEDSALIEIPNHIWGLKSYVGGSTITMEDRKIVSTGWIYIQRLSQQFASVFRPTEDHFGEAVEFLREVVQEACNEYYSRVETAVVMYVNNYFVKPVATTDAEAVEYESAVNTMTKACRRVRVSMTRDKTCPRWSNWFHLYQLLKGLWEDKPGNQLSPKNFVYTFLKKKRVKTPNITRTELADIDKEFLLQLYPGRKSAPYQSPLIQRVAFSRNKKLYDRIKEHTLKSTGLSFMIDRPRANKDFQKQQPYHTWQEVQGRKLFYLYDQKIDGLTSSGTSQRKRDRVDEELETGARLKLDQSTQAMSDTDDVRGNIQVMTTAFKGTPSAKMLIDMIEELHGRGTYLDYIRVRQTRTQEEQQALMGITSYQDDLDNLTYYPTNEIMFQCGEQRTHDPSTLTGSNHENSDDTMAGLEGMLAMAQGSPDYSSFIDHVPGLDDMEESPEKKVVQLEEDSHLKYGAGLMNTTTKQVASGGFVQNGITSKNNKAGEETGRTVDKVGKVTESQPAQPDIPTEMREDKQDNNLQENALHNKKCDEIETDNNQLRTGDNGKNNKTVNQEKRGPEYDTNSYLKTVGSSEVLCSGCKDGVKKGETMYQCNNCTNNHLLCEKCMVDPEDESLLAQECKHSVYEETESYERCTGATYSFMDATKPKKKCSTCGVNKKPTHGKPIYYCRKCRLHRVCMDCWKKIELETMEKGGGRREIRVRGRKTKEG